MADIAISNPTQATKDAGERGARCMRMWPGSFVTGGNDYRTGGIDLSPIAKNIAFFQAEGGKYLWVFDRANQKLKAMKAVDTDTNGVAPAVDGTLVEEDDQTAMTITVTYFAITFPNVGPGIDDEAYIDVIDEGEHFVS